MTTRTFLFDKYIRKALSYDAYVSLVKDLLSENSTTGINQTEDLVAYTKLNVQRMERLQKTVVISDDLQKAVQQIATPQTWLAITEGWCGDAAQNLPLFNALAKLNHNITFKLVLRDENLDLMEHYKTNGANAIPIVIAISCDNKQLWQWGPRPAEAQKIIIDLKKIHNGITEEVKTGLHTWYAKNKTIQLQHELLGLLKAV